MSEQQAAERIDWTAVLAETVAKQDFYRALGRQIERAGRGEVGLPQVPPVDELAFVDGFLVWNGRPVWWSGESSSAAVTERLHQPGFVEASITSPPVPVVERPHRARPHLRRWFGLW